MIMPISLRLHTEKIVYDQRPRPKDHIFDIAKAFPHSDMHCNTSSRRSAHEASYKENSTTSPDLLPASSLVTLALHPQPTPPSTSPPSSSSASSSEKCTPHHSLAKPHRAPRHRRVNNLHTKSLGRQTAVSAAHIYKPRGGSVLQRR